LLGCGNGTDPGHLGLTAPHPGFADMRPRSADPRRGCRSVRLSLALKGAQSS